MFQPPAPAFCMLVSVMPAQGLLAQGSAAQGLSTQSLLVMGLATYSGVQASEAHQACRRRLMCLCCCCAAAGPAVAVYGSADLSQANTVFLDSSFGMGYNLRELAQVCVDTCSRAWEAAGETGFACVCGWGLGVRVEVCVECAECVEDVECVEGSMTWGRLPQLWQNV